VKDDKMLWNDKRRMPRWIAALKKIYTRKRPSGMNVESSASIQQAKVVIKALQKRLEQIGGGLMDTTSRLTAPRKSRKKSVKKPKAKRPKAKQPKAKQPKQPKRKSVPKTPQETSYFIF